MSIVLNNGDLLEGDATTASKVTYVIGGLDGDTPIRLASGQLPNAKGTLYTAVGVDTITSIAIKNTNTTAEAVNLYVQDGTASRQILGITALGAKCHAQFDGNKLQVEDENGVIQTVYVAHATKHQDGGTDEISVAGLSGLLADDQHVLDAEVTAVAVAKALYTAYTVLMATTNATPEAITIAVQQVVGRITGGAIKGLSVAELQTLLFSAALGATMTLGEKFDIILDTLLSGDETWCGISELGTMGYAATVGDLMYLAVADTKWEMTDADAAATAFGKLGICLATTAENSTCLVLLWGKVRSAAFPAAFTIGAPVFVSTTAGDVQVAAPTGTTDIVRIVGYGNTAEDLFFCPDNTYLELV